MNETQNDAFSYYPQDFQTEKTEPIKQPKTQNILGQNNNLLSMLLSGKMPNPLEGNPLFSAISSIQKQKSSPQTQKIFDDDFFEDY